MRKRSKKRIPQDEKPWIRISLLDEEKINMFHKKTSQWTSGNRRFTQTAVFNNIQEKIASRLLNKYVSQNSMDFINNKLITVHQQLFRRYYTNKFLNLAKAKNFCLFLGRGRTYNRKLFISRHTIRKLTKTGMISGLIRK